MNSHFVYIIYSASHDIYYKGYSTNVANRVDEHNNNQSRFTSGKGPWELVFYIEFDTKRSALIEELRLKKLNRKSIEKIIDDFNQNSNTD